MADAKKPAAVPSYERTGKPDWNLLIPELADYLSPGPAEPSDYAHGQTQIEVALGFSYFFWPPFVLVGDMVFRGLPERWEEGEGIAQWLKKFDGDKSKVEEMLNHEHLVDLFDLRYRQASNAQIEYLAGVVQDMWTAKLARDFPERSFVVELYREANDPLDWYLTFFQKR